MLLAESSELVQELVGLVAVGGLQGAAPPLAGPVHAGGEVVDEALDDHDGGRSRGDEAQRALVFDVDAVWHEGVQVEVAAEARIRTGGRGPRCV